jgi:hypothetical protein
MTIILGASASVLYLYYMPSHLTLAIADPPPSPYSNNVTAIYVSVSEVDIHAASADNNSGWHTIASSFTLNLMSVLSTSKLLGTTTLPPGKYSELRFYASDAVIILNGVNLTYSIPGGGQTGIKVVIPNGGFHIYGGQSLTVQLDLSFNNSEIMNNPTMKLNPVATATVN